MECCSVIAAPESSPSIASGRPDQRAFLAASALLFIAAADLTSSWSASMAHGMPMPGGWTMTMVWMPIRGETWAHAAERFLVMWFVMMVAMMLPSLVPTLWRYRIAIAGLPKARVDRLTAIVAGGYFCAWTLLGLAIFPIGIAVASLEMHVPTFARAVPVAAGVVAVAAGALQFTAWKAGHLARCRTMLSRDVPATNAAALWGGFYLGGRCIQACAGLMAILIVVGLMDLRTMAVVTAAITVERVAPTGDRIARTIGGIAVVTGLLVMAGSAQL
jgi:predicted metal-binding membrane protein